MTKGKLIVGGLVGLVGMAMLTAPSRSAKAAGFLVTVGGVYTVLLSNEEEKYQTFNSVIISSEKLPVYKSKNYTVQK